MTQPHSRIATAECAYLFFAINTFTGVLLVRFSCAEKKNIFFACAGAVDAWVGKMKAWKKVDEIWINWLEVIPIFQSLPPLPPS